MKLILKIEKLEIVFEDETAAQAIPDKVLKAAEMWANGATCAEIGEAFNSSDGTSFISVMRKSFPTLFPYRNPKSRRNGISTHSR